MVQEPNLAHCCFCMGHKLGTVFAFLRNWKKKSKKNNISRYINIICNSNFSVHKKVLLEHSSFVYVSSIATFVLWGTCGRGCMAHKPKLFSIWSFIEKVCLSLISEKEKQNNSALSNRLWVSNYFFYVQLDENILWSSYIYPQNN